MRSGSGSVRVGQPAQEHPGRLFHVEYRTTYAGETPAQPDSPLGREDRVFIHEAMLYLPLGHALLGTEPVSLLSWAVLFGLALTVFVAIELHKVSWNARRSRTDVFDEAPRSVKG